MANKPMGFLNIGSDNYETVDVAGRQATHELALTVSQLSASNLPYSSTQSTKEKIDEVAEQMGWTYGGEISTGHSVTFPSGVTKEWLFVCYTSNGNSIKDSLQIECNGGIGIAYIVGNNQLSRSGLTISLSSTSTDKIKFFYKIY